MDSPLKNTNGPRITFIGANVGLLAFAAVLVKKAFFPGYENSSEANDGFLALFLFILLPLMFIGGVMFLAGMFKTWMFYSELTQKAKLLFWITVVLAPLILFAGITYNSYLNRPSDVSDREIYCGQQSRNTNTAEGVDAYYSCVDDNPVQDTESQETNALQVVPLSNP